jgi:dienelactone hydrolase
MSIARNEAAAALSGINDIVRLVIGTIAMLCGVSTSWAAAGAGQTERLTFQAQTYVGFRELMTRQPETASATVPARLSFPDEAKDRYPAVVVVHTIAGYQEANEGWHAAQLRKAGFATLTYESSSARGLLEASITGAGAVGLWASAVAEAFAALQWLAGDPRIDAAHIAIVGFSFGGEVAHLTASERLRAAVVPGRLGFAAHVLTYPAGVYGAALGQGAHTGAPILMLLGDSDDNLPVAKARGYLDYAQSGASPIEARFFAGAYHAWTVPGSEAGRFYPQYGSTRKCPFMLLGPAAPTLLVDGQEKPFDPRAFRTCMDEGRGYTLAYDAAARDQSTRETIAFLRKYLQP